MDPSPHPHALSLRFLSYRYLRPKRSFVSLITLISVFGVVLGVWIVAATTTIMSGYMQEIRKTVLGIEPHIVVTNDGVMYDWQELMPRIRGVRDVIDAAPFSHGEVVLDTGKRPRVVSVRGLDPRPGPILDGLSGLIQEGAFDLSDDNIIIGKVLADELKLKLGDSIILHSLANGQEMLRAAQEGREIEEFIVPAELKITGIYSSGRHDYDKQLVFIPLEHGQTLYRLEWGVHGIAVQLADPYAEKAVKNAIVPLMPETVRVSSWIDANEGLFRMLTMQRVILSTLLAIIMLAAGGCIMGTMITVTSQKRREIGLLKALGAPLEQILGVFVLQGAIVGMIGTALGLVATFVFLSFREQVVGFIAQVTGINVFASDIYLLYNLPASPNFVDIAIISAASFLACSLCSLLPAWYAAKLDAAQALRSESTV